MKSILSNQAPQSELERFLIEQHEAVYRSSWTKPLGKGLTRGLRLSDAAKAPGFRFGIKQTTDETNAAKKLIFPRNSPSNSEQDEKLYQKTHHDYPPRQPVDRHHAVEHIDLHNFRFGKSYVREVDGAKQCLSVTEVTEGTRDEASKAVEDYRRICYPDVGKKALSVAGNPDVPADFAFGLATRHDLSSVADCLNGFYSLAEQQPDVDLGRSRAHRSLAARIALQDGSTGVSLMNSPSQRSSAFQSAMSNPAFQAQKDRRFGVPSIRTDIAPPKKRRIDDCVNYDDELSVGQLLTPAPFEAWGVLDQAFLIPRTRLKLLDLVRKSVGLSYADKPTLEQAVDAALGRKEKEQLTANEGEKQEVMASLMDVLDVFTRTLDERIAQETCSLTQTDRLTLQF
ncbi:Flagella associated protein, related [Neospora caninum Liverpool]|nr:Flagella associated protein, related [Neospora caninum Liverpool]CBZ55942.1 Flagella associated protein, related [Neospora caninum Liverpool]|eukprot:XP_003885968.1 Flagella associated protein, related [Neospora caninum Liverpool]